MFFTLFLFIDWQGDQHIVTKKYFRIVISRRQDANLRLRILESSPFEYLKIHIYIYRHIVLLNEILFVNISIIVLDVAKLRCKHLKRKMTFVNKLSHT